jgi:uncharacterized OB-fold protein
VSRGLAYDVCRSCGLAVFPPRALCARCGSASWRRHVAQGGVLEDATTLRRAPGGLPDGPIRLGTVRLDAGPAVVVRLHGEAAPGARVALETVDGAPHAHEAE